MSDFAPAIRSASWMDKALRQVVDACALTGEQMEAALRRMNALGRGNDRRPSSPNAALLARSRKRHKR